MNPSITGRKYDKFAQFWHDRHHDSAYGIPQIKKALQFAQNGGQALDVGCGAGGRFVRLMEEMGFSITGLDVSQKMIKLAKLNHPDHTFLHQDICTWETNERFDFILAWDSIFHLPYEMQRPVIAKLATLLADGGVLTYTFGNEDGDHRSCWQNEWGQDETFYYSSIGINENLRVLMGSGLSVVHLELDQYPEKHVFVAGVK